jgi:hypothetical protein
MQEAMARMGRNVEFFLARRYRSITGYAPDLAALRAASTRLVVAGGADSSGSIAGRCAAALAERLGTRVVEFPGGHGGFSSHPREFADTLGGVFLAHVA